MPRPPNLKVRETILIAALELFSERGYKDSSMAEVAGAASIKKATLFYYFPTKELLGLAMLEATAELTRERVSSRLGSAPNDPVASIGSLFRDVRLGSHSGFFGGIALEMASASPLLRKRVGEVLEVWISHLEGVLQGWKEQELIKPDVNCRSTASAIVDLWQGAMSRSDIEGSPAPFEQAEMLAASFIHSILIK